MRSRVRENLPATLGASVGIFIVGWLGLTDWAWNDYDRESRPAFDALYGGHVLHFLQLVPSYGGSLIIRAPFALVPKLWAGGDTSIYRAAAFPCLLAGGVLGIWLVARLRERGAPLLTRVIVLALCTANPVILLALETGHAEDVLGAVLCVSAVLTARRDRSIWAGVLLGLAIANQEWGVLAIGPMLLALPRRRIRALVIAAGVTGAILLPLVFAGGFVSQVKGAATTNDWIFSPWQFFWFLGPHLHHTLPQAPWATRLDPAWLSKLAHPMIAAIAIPLTLLCVWLRRRGIRRPEHEALLLLMLVLFLRCALDPWDNWYYPLPFVIALLVWEVSRSNRPPAFALLASAVVWCLTQWVVPAHGVPADGQSVAFLLAAVPALLGISGALFAPGTLSRLPRLRWGRGEPAPSAA